MTRRTALIAGSVAVLSCAIEGSVPAPNVADAALAAGRWPGTSVEELNRGRDLYVARCAGCHQLKAPRSLGAEAWQGHIEEMRREQDVVLTDGEQLAMLKYLYAAASRDAQ